MEKTAEIPHKSNQNNFRVWMRLPCGNIIVAQLR